MRSETRARVEKVARELNYRPNLAARSLASARTSYLGAIVGDVTNPLQAQIARFAAIEAEAQGYPTIVSLDADTDEKAEHALESLLAHRVAGVILIESPYEKPAIAKIAQRIPSVYIGRLLKIVDIDSVTTDHVAGATSVVDHLVAQGCRRILHVGGGASPGAERMRQGYRAAMERHGLNDEISIIEAAYTVDSGAQAGREIFDGVRPVPEAIFVCNDLAAIGVINVAARRGIPVPDRVRVVGYDDVMLAGTETLSLSTVNQPAHELARKGVSAIVHRLKHPETPVSKQLVAPELIVRRSSTSPLS
ncbi:LacI family transcriptional regulator [Sinisalibacter aestuarii]|uniref:LacI family transcriptional regulator n=1 Tax=Sinisalibacter aestuarii TaxID=2949426 RepID=A0ABQ5LQX1_9RHOB|nr:LacI family transcriptional regulator [Sinisalibacter aestuarii]